MVKQFSLAACRINAGMTQSQVAEHLNRSNSTINKWEHYKVRVPGSDLIKLSKLYDVPIELIFLPDVSTVG